MRFKLVAMFVWMILSASLCCELFAEPVMPAGIEGKLASDRYHDRQKAYGELQRWAKKNLDSSPELLHRAWKATDEPEAKTRYYSLMKEMVLQRKFGRGKGFVGIQMGEVLLPGKEGGPARPGVSVLFVIPDTPAVKAGLRAGDVIVGVDDLDFSKGGNAGDAVPKVAMNATLKFAAYIQSKQPDDEVTLRLIRVGKLMQIKITLAKRPASADGGALGPPAEFDDFFMKWLKKMGE